MEHDRRLDSKPVMPAPPGDSAQAPGDSARDSVAPAKTPSPPEPPAAPPFLIRRIG